MQEIAQSRAEINRLREQLSSGVHTVHKDLSLISLVPKWSGGENARPTPTPWKISRKHRQGSTFKKRQDRDCMKIGFTPSRPW